VQADPSEFVVIWLQAKFIAPVPPPPVTVRIVVPDIPPKVAVMVAVPAATAVASPLLLTPATAGVDELKVTWVVLFWLVPSE